MASKYRIHYIYKIHFLCGFPTGRYYIGKHTHRAKTLKGDHYTGSGDFCIAYFKKYGTKEGITYVKEILEINPDIETNRIREAEIIGDLWKTDPLCMNRQPGGMTGSITGTKNTDKSYIKRKVNQYDLNGKFIKTWDSLTEANAYYSGNYDNSAPIISVCKGTNRKAYGYMWRYFDENQDDIEPIRDRKIIEGKHICQYDLNGKFIAKHISASDAAVSIGLNKEAGHQIARVCRKVEKEKKFFKSHNYLWRYSDNCEDLFNINRVTHSKKVIQLDINENKIKEFNSIKEAAAQTNINANSIVGVCKGRCITAGGYKWKYVEL